MTIAFESRRVIVRMRGSFGLGDAVIVLGWHGREFALSRALIVGLGRAEWTGLASRWSGSLTCEAVPVMQV